MVLAWERNSCTLCQIGVGPGTEDLTRARQEPARASPPVSRPQVDIAGDSAYMADDKHHQGTVGYLTTGAGCDQDTAPPGTAAVRKTFGRKLLATVLALGPLATTWAIVAHRSAHVLAPASMLSGALWVFVVVAWSPVFFFSVPALAFSKERDRVLPWPSRGLLGAVLSLVRGVILVPYMILSPRSRLRSETLLGVVGWLAACVVAGPYLH